METACFSLWATKNLQFVCEVYVPCGDEMRIIPLNLLWVLPKGWGLFIILDVWRINNMYTCEKIIGIRDSFYLITMMMIIVVAISIIIIINERRGLSHLSSHCCQEEEEEINLRSCNIFWVSCEEKTQKAKKQPQIFSFKHFDRHKIISHFHLISSWSVNAVQSLLHYSNFMSLLHI